MRVASVLYKIECLISTRRMFRQLFLPSILNFQFTEYSLSYKTETLGNFLSKHETKHKPNLDRRNLLIPFPLILSDGSKFEANRRGRIPSQAISEDEMNGKRPKLNYF